MTKSINELYLAWRHQTMLLEPAPYSAYRAGHIQGSLDSLDLLNRAYNAVLSADEGNLGFSEGLDLLTDIEEQIGYIEEQTKA